MLAFTVVLDLTRSATLFNNNARIIPYHCGFCRERLETAQLDRTDYVWLILLVRPFQCPHCFNIKRRPLSWIGRLWPFTSFDGGRTSRVAKLGSMPVRVGDITGPVTRNLVGVARWVGKIGRGLLPPASFLWMPLSQISNKLWQRMSRRPSSGRSGYDDRRSRRQSQGTSDADEQPQHRDRQV